jgi:hypothetical protein
MHAYLHHKSSKRFIHANMYIHTYIHTYIGSNNTAASDTLKLTGSSLLKYKHFQAANIKTVTLSYFEIDKLRLAAGSERLKWLRQRLGL